jgi:hypothetical protein
MRLTVSLIAILACCAASAQDASITHGAAITASPAVQDGNLSALLDGRVETGIAFDVGTEGEGAISFDFGAPRLVSGIRFFQNSAYPRRGRGYPGAGVDRAPVGAG